MSKRNQPRPAPRYLRGPGGNTELLSGAMTLVAVERYLEGVARLVLNPAAAKQGFQHQLDKKQRYKRYGVVLSF